MTGGRFAFKDLMMDGENNESDANAKEEAIGDEGAFNVSR